MSNGNKAETISLLDSPRDDNRRSRKSLMGTINLNKQGKTRQKDEVA